MIHDIYYFGRALACNVNATFLKVVASGIVDKYIGESARVIREMFAYAKVLPYIYSKQLNLS